MSTTETEVSPALHCQTLAEYRLLVLRVRQSDIALRARCEQAWVSQVERGHLPKPWSRMALLKALNLERWESEFERMVLAAKKLNALAKPISETEPLFATGLNAVPAAVDQLSAECGVKAVTA